MGIGTGFPAGVATQATGVSTGLQPGAGRREVRPPFQRLPTAENR
jgi:hypothetical protein